MVGVFIYKNQILSVFYRMERAACRLFLRNGIISRLVLGFKADKPA
jgi:hypothetical protein